MDFHDFKNALATLRHMEKIRGENLQGRVDGLVKSLEVPFCVIPAKAGIQSFRRVTNHLDSGFHRSDDFLRSHQGCSEIVVKDNPRELQRAAKHEIPLMFNPSAIWSQTPASSSSRIRPMMIASLLSAKLTSIEVHAVPYL